MSKRILALSTVIAMVSVYFSFFRPSPDQESYPAEIRVKILADAPPESVSIIGAARIDVLDEQGYLVSSLEHNPFTPLRISRQQNGVALDAGHREWTASGVAIHSNGATPLSLHADRPEAKRTYRGHLVAYADPTARRSLYLINHVNIDDYVSSVVVWEYGPHHVEGMKAMSVVARTYAMRKLSPKKPFDVVDTHLDQVYKGVERVTANAKQAAHETSGQVLTHNGKLIDAVHFASSGGHTANNDDVWQSAPLPYLRGKQDPFDRDSPHFGWTAKLKRSEVLDVLSKKIGKRVRSVAVGKKSAEGRVRTMHLELAGGGRETIRGDRFRSALASVYGAKSIRSTLFSFKRSGNYYIFEGHGFGHGVGLSQVGARAMAQHGKAYTDILHFYYTGVRLEEAAVTVAASGSSYENALPHANADPRLYASTGTYADNSAAPRSLDTAPTLNDLATSPDAVSNGSFPTGAARDRSAIYSPSEVHTRRYAPDGASGERRSGW